MVGYAFMGAAHSQAWRTAGRFFDLPLEPELAVLCGRDAAAAGAAAAAAGLALGRDRLEGAADAATTSRWSTSARPATRTPRSPSPRWTPASTCCARSRWPTRSTRPGRWSRRPSGPGRPGCAAWSASTTGGCRRSRWPGSWWRRAGSGRSGTSARQYLQDWIVDPEFPLVWRLQAEKAGSGALGDIGAHIVDMAQFVTGDRLTGVSRAHRDVRQGAAAAGGVQRAVGVRRPTQRGPVTVDDAALFLGRFAGGALATLRGHPVRHRPQERDPAGGQRQRRLAGVRLRVDERAVVLRRHRGRRRPPGSGGSSSPSPTHPYAGAWWPPGHVLGYEHSFTHEVVDLVRDLAAGPTRRRRSPTGCRCSWCSTRWPGPRGRQRLADRDRECCAVLARRSRHGARWHDRSPCSPASGPTCRSRRWPGWPGSGATTGWRSPAGATTSTRGPPSRTTATSRAAARSSSQARPGGVRDLQPPHRAGRLRRPDRRAAPGHPARPGLGRRRAGGRAPAGRRGDEGDRAGRGEARRGHRRRLHRVEDLEDGGDVPAGAAVHGRRRLPGLRRPLEPDPRRVRRGRGAVRARGAPHRDRLRLLDRRWPRWRRSGTGRRSG